MREEKVERSGGENKRRYGGHEVEGTGRVEDKRQRQPEVEITG